MPDPGRDRIGVRAEDYYRMLVEQAADGIFVADSEGVYLDVNESGHRLLGYEAGELVGRHIRELLADGDRQRLEQTMELLRQGTSQTAEWQLRQRDGRLLPCEVTAQWLSNGVLVGVVREISRRKEAERKTQASEARLRSILETAPDIILTVDRAGTILFINRTLPPLSSEQVIGTSCYDYVPPESRARVAAAIEHVFTSRGFDEYEIQGPPGVDGARVWSSVRVGPLVENDRVVGATLCATDISSRKLEEAGRQELVGRLQKIASQVPGLVCQFKRRPDGSWCFPYASEQIRDIYRVSPEDVKEDASAVFEALHPDDAAGLSAELDHSARTLEPLQYEYRVKFANGDERWLFSNAVPERQADGAVLWHGFISDVTQRKEIEQREAALEAQLRQSQKVESIGRLAGGVAHDFNNLLTSVLGFTELAQAELSPGSPAASYLECVSEAANRGAALTQQLLAFARKKLVHPEIVRLNEVVEKLVPMLRRLVGEHRELTLSLAPALGAVKVDAGSMEQVVMNLVVNARDALTAAGHISVETANVVLAEADCQKNSELTPGEYVRLTVSDTGTGMSADVLARLFEPFFTTKPVGEGTGLGLAMCHGIVKQAHGSITVSSELGHGSSFSIYLPRVRSEVSGALDAPAEALPAAGRETVLLVEDEEMILRLVREALSGMGYRVLTAANGAEALALAEHFQESIDLVITDVVMPKMGGGELATRLAKLRPGIKVLYSSGYSEDEMPALDGLTEEAAFLHKPYTITALTARVRQALGREPH